KGPPVGAARTESAAARARRTQKELARLETQLGRLEERIAGLHELMAAVAHDHVRLGELTAELNEVLQRREDLEQAWLAAADE
ncbi:MAG: ABC transporter ATP-binding protein, partial [Mycolicibacterium sp.]|nr:ABC transporter ATP-binding protein [Mycolicibacterium sp.]